MTVLVVLLSVTAVAAIYFAVRFYALRSAIYRAEEELGEINGHISQNHVLRTDVPDRALDKLLRTANDTLATIRSERVVYTAREREFRSQIEAISHDLRTPLTVIIGYLKLMEPTGDEALGRVLRKACSMQKLVEEFYEYSRIICGDYPLSPAFIDAGRIIRESFSDNCLLLEERGLDIKVDLCDRPAEVFADQRALERIVVNLIQNAARYAEKTFSLSLDTGDGKVMATFENDANGLTKADADRLFERFYTADGSRGSGGTGLGLTIAQNLARRSGGELTAELTDGGENIRFTLTLPAADNTKRE